jgi:hypothetical protein
MVYSYLEGPPGLYSGLGRGVRPTVLMTGGSFADAITLSLCMSCRAT